MYRVIAILLASFLVVGISAQIPFVHVSADSDTLCVTEVHSKSSSADAGLSITPAPTQAETAVLDASRRISFWQQIPLSFYGIGIVTLAGTSVVLLFLPRRRKH